MYIPSICQTTRLEASISSSTCYLQHASCKHHSEIVCSDVLSYRLRPFLIACRKERALNFANISEQQPDAPIRMPKTAHTYLACGTLFTSTTTRRTMHIV